MVVGAWLSFLDNQTSMVQRLLRSRKASSASLLLASKMNCFRNSSRKRACEIGERPQTIKPYTKYYGLYGVVQIFFIVKGAARLFTVLYYYTVVLFFRRVRIKQQTSGSQTGTGFRGNNIILYSHMHAARVPYIYICRSCSF